MPWVAALALIGTLAIAGLPPLNGFVSEWLLFQAFLLTPGLPNSYLNMLVPVGDGGAGAGRGAGGLRDGEVLRRRISRPAARGSFSDAHDAGPAGARGPALARAVVRGARACCRCSWSSRSIRSRSMLVERDAARRACAIGLAVPDRRSPGARELRSARLPAGHRRCRCWRRFCWCAASTTAGCGARQPWDCGFPEQTARMQDTRRRLRPADQADLRAVLPHRAPHPEPVRRAARVLVARSRTASGTGCTCRSSKLTERAVGLVGVLQHGRIHVYLVYSFVTLLASAVLLIR